MRRILPWFGHGTFTKTCFKGHEWKSRSDAASQVVDFFVFGMWLYLGEGTKAHSVVDNLNKKSLSTKFPAIQNVDFPGLTPSVILTILQVREVYIDGLTT